MWATSSWWEKHPFCWRCFSRADESSKENAEEAQQSEVVLRCRYFLSKYIYIYMFVWFTDGRDWSQIGFSCLSWSGSIWHQGFYVGRGCRSDHFWLVLTGKLKVCHWTFFSPFRCQKSSQDVWQLSLHWFVSVWPKFPRYFHHPNSNLQLNTPLGHCAYRPGDIIIKASWPFQLFIGWNSLWWWNFSVRKRMELGYRYIMLFGNMNHHELTNR